MICSACHADFETTDPRRVHCDDCRSSAGRSRRRRQKPKPSVPVIAGDSSRKTVEAFYKLMERIEGKDFAGLHDGMLWCPLECTPDEAVTILEALTARGILSKRAEDAYFLTLEP
jgi:hypothetical protein